MALLNYVVKRRTVFGYGNYSPPSPYSLMVLNDVNIKILMATATELVNKVLSPGFDIGRFELALISMDTNELATVFGYSSKSFEEKMYKAYTASVNFLVTHPELIPVLRNNSCATTSIERKRSVVINAIKSSNSWLDNIETVIVKHNGKTYKCNGFWLGVCLGSIGLGGVAGTIATGGLLGAAVAAGAALGMLYCIHAECDRVLKPFITGVVFRNV